MTNYHANSGKQDFITPPFIIAAVREALGGRIELDVASYPLANDIIKAERYFTIDDDALQPELDWTAETVWMNHPFAAKDSPLRWNERWIAKLIQQYESGNIKAACCITFSEMSTGWGQMLGRYARWFPPTRINYIDPETMEPAEGAMKGSMVTYMGRRINHFAQTCMRAGGVVDVPWTLVMPPF